MNNAQFYLGAYELKSNFYQRKNLAYLIDRTFNEHVAIIAPSRSGKGVGYVIPNLLIWPDSAVVFDPKGELWNSTSAWREAQGHNCIRLSLVQILAHLNPFSEMDPNNNNTLKQIDQILFYLQDKSTKTDPFFMDHGRRFLRLYILFCLYSNKPVNLHNLAYLLTNYDKEKKAVFEVKNLLTQMLNNPNENVISEASYFLGQIETEAFTNWIANASILVSIFKEKALGEVTSKSDFKVSDLANIYKKPTTLYIQLGPDDTINKRYESVIRIIFNTIFVSGIYNTGLREKLLIDGQETYNKRNILVLIDEFHQLGEFRPLERALSDAGGYGAKLCLITQGDKQVDIEYNNKHSFWTSVNHLVFFRPNDIDTIRYICRRLGKVEEEVPILTETTSESTWRKQTSKATSYQRITRDLLLEAEIGSLPEDKVIIFSKGLKIYANKIDYRNDKELNHRQSYGAATRYNLIEDIN